MAQTHLSTLQPHKLQVIVNLPVTSDAVEEASEVDIQRLELKLQEGVSRTHEQNVGELSYPWTLS